MCLAGRSMRRVDRHQTPERQPRRGLRCSFRLLQSCRLAPGRRSRAVISGSPHDIPLPTHKPRILTQALRATVRAASHLLSPGQALAIVVLGLAGVAAFGITPDTTLDTLAVRSITRALPLPALANTDDGADRYWREERVQSEEHTSELQSHVNLVCRLLL